MQKKVLLQVLCLVVCICISLNFIVSTISSNRQHKLTNRIFFIESSGRNTLNFRQSCAVESAARQNRNRQIQIFISNQHPNLSSPSLSLLADYDNVNVEPFTFEGVFNNTPFEEWYRNGMWKTSPFRIAHMADYLRILFSWMGGGLYLDLDFVVTRPLEDLRNFVVYSIQGFFANGVFHFDKGHPIVDRMMEALSRTYKPDVWAAQGPDMITLVIRAHCNVAQGFASGQSCGPGVRLLPETSFFPVHYNDMNELFRNNTSYELPEHLVKNYAVHAWNRDSSNTPIYVGSSQYYAILAAKFCPLSFAAALNRF